MGIPVRHHENHPFHWDSAPLEKRAGRRGRKKPRRFHKDESIRGENPRITAVPPEIPDQLAPARSKPLTRPLSTVRADNAATRPAPTDQRGPGKNRPAAPCSAGRLRDQYSHRAACLLTPTAGSLKSRRAAFFPSQSFVVSSYYTRNIVVCQGGASKPQR